MPVVTQICSTALPSFLWLRFVARAAVDSETWQGREVYSGVKTQREPEWEEGSGKDSRENMEALRRRGFESSMRWDPKGMLEWGEPGTRAVETSWEAGREGMKLQLGLGKWKHCKQAGSVVRGFWDLLVLVRCFSVVNAASGIQPRCALLLPASQNTRIKSLSTCLCL